jgi:hypothetical protein
MGLLRSLGEGCAMADGWGFKTYLATAAYAVAFGVAHAETGEPGKTIDGNGWIAIAIILGLVALVIFMIRGALTVSGRDKPDDDGAGFGVLEGIDDDEDEGKKRH